MQRYVLTMVLVAATAASAPAMDIASCGQTVPAGNTATLVADLLCGPDETGVTLGAGATLELDGHSVSGAFIGVDCVPYSCTVRGPGAIFGNQVGIAAQYGASSGKRPKAMRVQVESVDVHHNGVGISHEASGRLTLTNVNTDDNAQAGIFTFGNKIVGTNVSTSRNGVTEGGFGLKAVNGKALLDGFTAVGNSVPGYGGGVVMDLRRVRIVHGTVTGNGDMDVFAPQRPRLIDTVCDHSGRPDGGTWGLCGLD